MPVQIGTDVNGNPVYAPDSVVIHPSTAPARINPQTVQIPQNVPYEWRNNPEGYAIYLQQGRQAQLIRERAARDVTSAQQQFEILQDTGISRDVIPGSGGRLGHTGMYEGRAVSDVTRAFRAENPYMRTVNVPQAGGSFGTISYRDLPNNNPRLFGQEIVGFTRADNVVPSLSPVGPTFVPAGTYGGGGGGSSGPTGNNRVDAWNFIDTLINPIPRVDAAMPTTENGTPYISSSNPRSTLPGLPQSGTRGGGIFGIDVPGVPPIPSPTGMTTYPVYEFFHGVGEFYRSRIVEPFIEPALNFAFNTPADRQPGNWNQIFTRPLITGMVESGPIAVTEMAGMTAPGAEILIRNPALVAPLAVAGLRMQAEGIYQGITERPVEFVGENIAMMAIMHGVSRGLSGSVRSPVFIEDVPIPRGAGELFTRNWLGRELTTGRAIIERPAGETGINLFRGMELRINRSPETFIPRVSIEAAKLGDVIRPSNANMYRIVGVRNPFEVVPSGGRVLFGEYRGFDRVPGAREIRMPENSYIQVTRKIPEFKQTITKIDAAGNKTFIEKVIPARQDIIKTPIERTYRKLFAGNPLEIMDRTFGDISSGLQAQEAVAQWTPGQMAIMRPFIEARASPLHSELWTTGRDVGLRIANSRWYEPIAKEPFGQAAFKQAPVETIRDLTGEWSKYDRNIIQGGSRSSVVWTGREAFRNILESDIDQYATGKLHGSLYARDLEIAQRVNPQIRGTFNAEKGEFHIGQEFVNVHMLEDFPVFTANPVKVETVGGPGYVLNPRYQIRAKIGGSLEGWKWEPGKRPKLVHNPGRVKDIIDDIAQERAMVHDLMQPVRFDFGNIITDYRTGMAHRVMGRLDVLDRYLDTSVRRSPRNYAKAREMYGQIKVDLTEGINWNPEPEYHLGNIPRKISGSLNDSGMLLGPKYDSELIPETPQVRYPIEWGETRYPRTRIKNEDRILIPPFRTRGIPEQELIPPTSYGGGYPRGSAILTEPLMQGYYSRHTVSPDGYIGGSTTRRAGYPYTIDNDRYPTVDLITPGPRYPITSNNPDYPLIPERPRYPGIPEKGRYPRIPVTSKYPGIRGPYPRTVTTGKYPTTSITTRYPGIPEKTRYPTTRPPQQTLIPRGPGNYPEITIPTKYPVVTGKERYPTTGIREHYPRTSERPKYPRYPRTTREYEYPRNYPRETRIITGSPPELIIWGSPRRRYIKGLGEREQPKLRMHKDVVASQWNIKNPVPTWDSVFGNMRAPPDISPYMKPSRNELTITNLRTTKKNYDIHGPFGHEDVRILKRGAWAGP
jgi:hypothetical protein